MLSPLKKHKRRIIMEASIGPVDNATDMMTILIEKLKLNEPKGCTLSLDEGHTLSQTQKVVIRDLLEKSGRQLAHVNQELTELSSTLEEAQKWMGRFKIVKD